MPLSVPSRRAAVRGLPAPGGWGRMGPGRRNGRRSSGKGQWGSAKLRGLREMYAWRTGL